MQTEIPLSANKLVLATRNKGKVRELKAMLSDLPIELLDLTTFPDAPLVIEDQETLEGNATKKAETIAIYTGLPALADDTGLEVEALNGRPGVHAARYAGAGCSPKDNREKMLDELRASDNRHARFRTVMALVDEGRVRFFDGSCEGTILKEERGNGGFGYDPIFVPDGKGVTFAEMSKEEKNQISHRAKAVAKVVAFLHESEDSPQSQ